MDVIAENADYFARRGKHGYYKTAIGACWGKITEDYIAINRTRITEELAKQGYSLNSVVDTWKSKGYIMTRSDGRWMYTDRLDSGTFSAIHLKNTLQVMQGMHRVCTAKTLKPRQGKAFKIRA